MGKLYHYFPRLFSALCATAFAAVAAEGAAPPAAWDFDTGIDGFEVINAESGSDTFAYNRWDRNVAYNGGYGDVADDYLVLPALELEAGLTYEVRYTAYASWYRTDWEPLLSWHIGQGATVGELSREVAAPVGFASSYDGEEHTFSFSVDTDGEYHLAACLRAGEAQGSVNFYIERIEICAGVSADAPAAPRLTVTPAMRGGVLVADIVLTAPVATVAGAPVEGEVAYSVFDAAGRFSADGTAEPGAEVRLCDEACDPAGGVYTAFASRGQTHGKEVTVGFSPVFDAPAAPSGITLAMDGDAATITWDPVTQGRDGGLFNPATVVYTVQRSDRAVVATKITETSVTDTPPVPDDGQTPVYYMVTAYGSADSYTGSSADSETILLGAPYAGCFSEKFAGGEASTCTWQFGPAGAAYSAWRPATASYSSPDCRGSRDGDGGFLLFTPSAYSDGTEYISPLIDMVGSANPMLEFYVYRYSSAPDEALLTLYVERGGLRTAIEGGELAFRADTDGWERVCLPLDGVTADGPFSLVFEGHAVGSAKVIVDDVTVRDVPALNLRLSGITTASAAYPGQEITVEVTVENDGLASVSGAVVELESDASEAVLSAPFDLEPGNAVTLTFPVDITPFMAGGEVEFTAVVSAEGDAVVSDDAASVVVTVGVCDLPAAGNLSAAHTAEGVEISWTAPEIDADPAPVAVAEGFENWEAGSTSPMNGWIFIDGDGAPKYGLAGVNEDIPYAFFVADRFSTSAVADIEAAEGRNVLLTTKNSDYSDTDSWLVSPVFDPSHAVSFKATAMSFRGYSPAAFELGWLPRGSSGIDDFVKVADVSTGGYDWEETTYEFPAGAGRFAIHVAGLRDNACAFDDFRFHAVPEVPVLEGFRIYRNGLPIGSAEAGARFHTDSGADASMANHYHVSCRYASGLESMEPDGFLLAPAQTVGLSQAFVGECPYAVSGETLRAFGPLEVWTADGRLRALLDGGGEVSLPTGVYLVKAAGAVSKIIIR